MRSVHLGYLSTCLLLPFSFSTLAEAMMEHIVVTGDHLDSVQSLSADTTANTSPDLKDSLTRLPGISINGNGPVTSIIQYRGLFGHRVNVKLDGGMIAGAGPNSMDSPLSYVASSSAPTISIYRGIAPVSAGYETIGGAVVVENDMDLFAVSNEVEWHGMTSVSGVDNGEQYHAGAGASVATDTWFVAINGQHQKGDEIKDGHDNDIPSSHYRRGMYQVQGGYQQGAHKLTAMLSRSETGASGTPALAMDIDYIDSTLYRVAYDYDADAFDVSLKIYGNDSKHGMDNFRRRFSPAPANYRETIANSESHGAALTISAEADAMSWKAGVEWDTAEHEASIGNPENAMFRINNFQAIERDVMSAFGEAGYMLDAATEINIGLRYTKVDSSAGHVAHSMAMMNQNIGNLVDAFNQADRDVSHDLYDVVLGFSHQLNSAWSINATLAQKERAPTYQELFSWFPLGVSGGMADGKNYVGDLNLEKETARQIDMGFDYQGEKLNVSPRIFYQKIDDYIQGTFVQEAPLKMIASMMGDPEPLRWSNTDATLYGVDVLARYAITEAVGIESTLTYTRGERDDVDEALYRIAPLTAFIRLGWDVEQFHFMAEAKLVAKQNRVSLTQNEQQSRGYGLMNLSATYQDESGLMFFARVDNLFDKFYEDHLAGVNRVMNADLQQGARIPGYGRQISMGVSYAF